MAGNEGRGKFRLDTSKVALAQKAQMISEMKKHQMGLLKKVQELEQRVQTLELKDQSIKK